MKWISFKDRIAHRTTQESVIVFEKIINPNTKEIIYYVQVEDVEDIYVYPDYVSSKMGRKNITHWMPLPKPPTPRSRKWIKFKDKFPNISKYTQIITFEKMERFDTKEIFDYISIQQVEWIEIDEDGIFYSNICGDGNFTHWMPLPEYPKTHSATEEL